MKSSVLTVEVWYRDNPYWIVVSENEGFCEMATILQDERLAADIHAARAERFAYWHRCQNFIGDITPLADGIEFLDEWENEDE